MNLNPIELAEFTELVGFARRRVVEDAGSLLVTNGELHSYLSENSDGTFTIEENDRNPYDSPSIWIADIADATHALRYLLITLCTSFRRVMQPRLVLPTALEDLPEGASVGEVPPASHGPLADRENLYIDGRYIGTFGRDGDRHSAVAAAHLLPLTLEELTALFRDVNRVSL